MASTRVVWWSAVLTLAPNIRGNTNSASLAGPSFIHENATNRAQPAFELYAQICLSWWLRRRYRWLPNTMSSTEFTVDFYAFETPAGAVTNPSHKAHDLAINTNREILVKSSHLLKLLVLEILDPALYQLRV